METLNYEVLEKSGYTGYIKKSAPEKGPAVRRGQLPACLCGLLV